MKINISTLSENTANFGFLAEWGLSLLVEADDTRILFDTGLSFSAVHNAKLMGIDLSEIDCIVISHGHADHTGGLREVLKICGDVPVIGHPDIWTAKYVKRNDGPEKYCGIPFSAEQLESLGARFKLGTEPVRIADGITTTGEIPMLTGYEYIEDNLFVKEDGLLQPDKLADDLSLVIDTVYGLVVILGCAHRGLINTLRHAQKITGNKSVYAAVGGTHLLRASQERMDNTVADLKKMGIQRLGVSHCTGFHACARLASEFEDSFFANNAGNRFILP